jgi:8-oxo-dGTP pyrophosphatase MutT (NUDIX family)
VQQHREGRWLLTVRGADVDDAAGQLGLVGGHVEPPGPAVAGPGVLEATARREAFEEVGLDLGDATLTYLESELFTTDAGVGQVTVAFLAAAPPDQEPGGGGRPAPPPPPTPPSPALLQFSTGR